MRVMIRLLILILMGFTLVDCGYAAGGKIDKNKANTKGANKEMKTYQMGRFAIDLPLDFKLAEQKHEFRLVEIEEIPIPHKQVSGLYAEQRWKERLAEIEKLTKPDGVKKIVIKQQNLADLQSLSRGVLYYDDYMTVRRGTWEIWVDYDGQITVFKLTGLIKAQDSMLSWLTEVIRAYRPTTTPGVSNAFYTRHGVIDLPYKRQEKTFARFKGPMEMVLTIEMIETHKNAGKKSISERTVDAIAAGFTRNLDIKTISAGARVVAGLHGDEEILQGDDGGQKHLRFDWEYLGRAESGEFPAIQINMETNPDNQQEKMHTWNKILNSFQSTPKSTR